MESFLCGYDQDLQARLERIGSVYYQEMIHSRMLGLLSSSSSPVDSVCMCVCGGVKTELHDFFS